jgi:uncharacterized protein YwbE
MLNLSLNVYVGEPKTDGETTGAVVNQALVSSMVEMPCGIKVTLTTGEVFLCSDEFVPTFMKANSDIRYFAQEDRMFQFWQNAMANLATETYKVTEPNAKETAKRIALVADVVTKIGKEWNDFRNEVM